MLLNMKSLATITEIQGHNRKVIAESTFEEAQDAVKWCRKHAEHNPKVDWTVTKDKKVVDTNAWEDYI